MRQAMAEMERRKDEERAALQKQLGDMIQRHQREAEHERSALQGQLSELRRTLQELERTKEGEMGHLHQILYI